MSELKKIDYRELDKKIPEKTASQTGEVQEAGSVGGEEKLSFFSSLAGKWSLMDKKTKIEIGVLAVIIILTIGAVIYYFINRAPIGVLQAPTKEPPMENFEEFYLNP